MHRSGKQRRKIRTAWNRDCINTHKHTQCIKSSDHFLTSFKSFMQRNPSPHSNILASQALFSLFFLFCLFLPLCIPNFPLIGANFPVLLFLSLTGGLNKLTKAAQLCRNLPTLINGFVFFPTSQLNLHSSVYLPPWTCITFFSGSTFNSGNVSLIE